MRITRRKFIISSLLASVGVAIIDAFWLEKFFIETNKIYLYDTSPGDEHIKIVQISDLHLQSVNYQLEQMVKKINRLKPDLIVFTGDAIDKAKNHTVLVEFLQLIDKTIPKVAILGNWEYWSGLSFNDLSEIYAKHNINLLVNQNIQFNLRNKTIGITGIDDYLGGKPNFEKAIIGLPQCDYHIVLNHCPMYSDYIAKKQNETRKVDLILSGHTHGGQVNLLGYVPYTPWGSGKYLKGMYDQNNTKIYVSKGIGTTFLPIRFGARAEIAVFYLKA